MGWFGNMLATLPARCVFCRLPVRGQYLCRGCRADLPASGPACPRCAGQVAVATSIACGRCQRRPPPWTRAVALLPYSWPVDNALKALKFSRQLAYAAAFGELLLPVFEREFRHVDALCPVPLYRWRQARRGFNQATELCRPLARASGLPMLAEVRRVRATAPQPGLGRRARRRNLKAAFAMRPGVTAVYAHVLLVDDVMTTGETCRQLARTLLAHGVAEVSVLVVARAATPGQAGGVASKV